RPWTGSMSIPTRSPTVSRSCRTRCRRSPGSSRTATPSSATEVPLDSLRTNAPGLLLAFGLALVAGPLAEGLGGLFLAATGASGRSPVSPIPVAVVLGLLVANTAGLPEAFAPGVKVAVKRMLQLGIVLVGLKLSVLDVLKVG